MHLFYVMFLFLAVRRNTLRCISVKCFEHIPSSFGFNANAGSSLSLYCIVFIHFYSASHGMSLSEALPTIAIDTVSEFTRRSATGNWNWRTCSRSLRGFEPATLRSKRIDSTSAPPRLTHCCSHFSRCPFAMPINTVSDVDVESWSWSWWE